MACAAKQFGGHSCERAFNGKYIGQDWATQTGTMASIQFIFPGMTVVQYVVLWFRCAELDQSDVVTFVLSDGTSQQVNHVKLIMDVINCVSLSATFICFLIYIIFICINIFTIQHFLILTNIKNEKKCLFVILNFAKISMENSHFFLCCCLYPSFGHNDDFSFV